MVFFKNSGFCGNIDSNLTYHFRILKNYIKNFCHPNLFQTYLQTYRNNH